jgi:hypothetical protein
MTRSLNRGTILDLQEFLKVRPQKYEEIKKLKRQRRLEVGPYATFYFECYETLWWQIHEMLRIEGGGDEQIIDELEAYTPLLPNGSDWVCTLMFEIPNAEQRRHVLAQLGHIEDTIYLDLEGAHIVAQPVGPDVRTDRSGKTSAVHFLRFPFNSNQVQKLTQSLHQVTLGFAHPNYLYAATIPSPMLKELIKDLSC